MHIFKAKLKTVKLNNVYSGGQRRKHMMINTFLNIHLRLEGILHHLCKRYTACTECKGWYYLIDSLKVVGEDFCFVSVGMLFQILDLGEKRFHCHDILFV